jgi:hypothetical protein
MVLEALRRCLERLKSPRGSLAFLAWLTGVLLQTGAFGTVDTTRRYQVTRALWRDEPPVALSDAGFGIVMPDGTAHPWYGIGQSLLMLPGDLAAGALTRVVGIASPLREQLEAALTAFITFPLVTALTAVVAYSVLRELGDFSERHSVLGVTAWLLGTSVLHYVQVAFENSLDLLVCVVILLHASRWAKHGSRADLAVAAVAAGVNVLARIPNVVDASVLLGAVLLANLPREHSERRRFAVARVRDLALVWLPILVAAFALDRAYQVVRFGWDAVGTTYIHLYGAQARRLDPSLAPSFPFSGRFALGFWGPLVSRNRSVFLFDPLASAGLALVLIAWLRGRLPRVIGFITAACLVTLLVRTVAFARLEFWDGSTSWSNRYTLTPVQLWMLFSVPLLLSLKPALGRIPRVLFGAAIAAGIVFSLASVLAHPNLEQIQAICERREVNFLADRLANVRRELFGTDPARLSSGGCVEEKYRRIRLLPWDNARDLPSRLQMPVRIAWGACFVVWLLALGRLLTRRLGARAPDRV